MKKFVFSLEALYDVKKAQRDALQRDLAAAEEALRAAEEKKAQLEATLDARSREYEEKARRGMTAGGMQGYAVYFEDMRERIRKAAAEVERARNQADRVRGELVAVHKEIKVLEKLYEKQYAEFAREMEKKETKAVEDIVSYRAAEGPKENPA